MKIRSVTVNARKRQLELTVRSGATCPFPFSRLDPPATVQDPLADAWVDKELGNEAVGYRLESGREGAVHIEHALEYNEDPAHLAGLLRHRRTVEALHRIDECGLSRREVARRLRTSLAQVYRLLDPTNLRKDIGQFIALLHVLDCEVQVVVKSRRAA